MRCVFCAEDSSTSRSIEHIVPESLGNTKYVLPKGVVCDACNNYFARKVEKPLLESDIFQQLRFHQALPSKRGRVPPLKVVIAPGTPTTLFRASDEQGMHVLDITTEGFQQILADQDAGKDTVIVFPSSSPLDEKLMSRLMAKCAIEALAQRLLEAGLSIEPLVDDSQYALIKSHARRGTPSAWTIHARDIYDANRRIVENNQGYQTVYEYDFLLTTPDRVGEDGAVVSEVYFVFALFGREFAINLGGPDVDGYVEWLERHDYISPLYFKRLE